ncbi:hypothetical protein R1sor_008859 [Riccia sorocarpa]|uniref:RRM domain-containing protein n=1 Tax=Riccia sorocarpa TaxID=122646 RepID=A0ABD3H7M8_9MARC
MAAVASIRNAAGSDSVKLFVGQVPKQLTEQQIAAIFGEAGVVREINIIKDKLTKQSRGCCFVIYNSREEADNAIALFHDRRTLPPVASPLQVKYADGELERLEHKLFVGMLPNSVTEADVSNIFSKFGRIKELSVIKGSQPNSKGCAFLKYESKDQAIAAIEALNGHHKMEGSTSALVVKWADTEKERLARKQQRAQASATNRLAGQQQPSLFGAMPIGYVTGPSPVNGYSYQVYENVSGAMTKMTLNGLEEEYLHHMLDVKHLQSMKGQITWFSFVQTASPYGLMPYSTPPVQSQQAISSGIMGPVNLTVAVPEQQSPELMSHMTNPNFQPVPYAGYIDPVYQSLSGMQYPMAYSGTLLYQGLPQAVGTNGMPIVGMSPGSAGPLAANTGIAPQTEGPPGANLFIYHIPLEFGDQELSTTFSSFGNVISAKVFVDRATGASKCFGFVSYDSPEAAQAAINVMNGFQLSGKRLKVQLKRDTKQGKPGKEARVSVVTKIHSNARDNGHLESCTKQDTGPAEMHTCFINMEI